MLRVLHSVSYMHRAGVETFIMNYFRHINRNVVQFDFLCNKNVKGDYDDEIKSLGGRIFYRPGFDLLKEENYVEFWKKFLNEHPEINIIHTHNGAKQYYPLQGAKMAEFPVRIAHAHSSDFVHDERYDYRKSLIERIPEVASHYFGCSAAAGRFFFGDKIWSNDGILIRNAVPCEQFALNEKEREKFRLKLDLKDCFVIGHVGRFMAQKNHARLLNIFKLIYNKNSLARLLLIGTGELEWYIRKRTKQLGLEKVVIFAGNQVKMYQWYQVMDVFVLPSFFEGLPVSGIEAQAAGLPCVFSDVISSEAAIIKDVSYMSLNASDLDWAEVIMTLGEHKRYNTSEVMRNAGYDIVNEAKRLERIYVNLLSINIGE